MKTLKQEIEYVARNANCCGYKPNLAPIFKQLDEIRNALEESRWFIRDKYWPQPTGILAKIDTALLAVKV
jgi:hypothetical protein